MANKKKSTTVAEPTQAAGTTDASQSASNAVALAPSKDSIQMQVVDMSTGTVPDLDDAQEVPIDLMSDYWTPERIGEEKRLYFDRIQEREVLDINDPTKTAILSCAFFIEKTKDQPARSVCNGSKRLVGLLEQLEIKRGTPLCITYQGKKKNRQNNFQSDIWSVKPLIIKLK